MMNYNPNFEEDKLNSFIYEEMDRRAPSRYEMIKYSTWRIHLFNQLEAIPIDRSENKNHQLKSFNTMFPNLVSSSEQKSFYSFISSPSVRENSGYHTPMRMDNISHFICRMLYCQEDLNHQTFLSMERRILEGKIWRELPDNTQYHRKNLMVLLKKLLGRLREIDPREFNIGMSQWEQLGYKIHFINPDYMDKMEEYAKLTFELAEQGIRRRRSFIFRGYVYVSIEVMADIVLSNYQYYLKKKIIKTKPIVTDLIVDDVENQFSSFLLKTIKQINQEGIDDTKFNGKFNLTLRNVDALGPKHFPPCMLNLFQNLKVNRHLRHDGRRQLWGFFKACGMEAHDNKEYFRKHFEGKVTASQMKTHMYNIQHAYGLQGKRKAEHAWMCRNIISGTAPKKGQHHGCPFYHWRGQELQDFLRKNYRVTEDNLKQIMRQKEDKHFQVACGRLFEYSEVNKQGGQIPSEITAKLGKAPYLYYEAGMQLRESKLKKEEAKGDITF